MSVERKTILLRAAYDLIVQQEDSPYVLNTLETTAKWDDAECDGYCLLEEIRDELNIKREAL